MKKDKKDIDDESSVSSSKSSSSSSGSKITPASFSDLFRFSTTQDKAIFALGVLLCVAASATPPLMIVIFGDAIDASAVQVSAQEQINRSAMWMVIAGVYGFFTFFFSFFCCGWAASRVANAYRTQFLEAILRQDAAFFDNTEPGSLSLMLSDSAMDIQSGLADKFAQAAQGGFQLVFGFAVAFSFGPLLTLVLMACLPLLIAITTAMINWGSEDGIFGKEAYERAASVANETLSNMRTVLSLNAEVKMSEKYDENLGASEKASVREAARASFLAGLLFCVMFCMYGLGFWYGARLIADSTDYAIEQHPPPSDFFDPSPDSPYAMQYAIISSDLVCGEYVSDDGTISEALEVCACGIPWESTGLESPSCGCGFDEGSSGGMGLSILEGCFSGGTLILVFFAVLIGGFGAGMLGPGVKALGTARVAAARMLKVIERQPEVDITQVNGKTRLESGKVKGEITFEDMHFRYKALDDDTNDATNAKGESGSDEPEGRLVFGGCNLTMKPGETVALVGESGCGKSTIAKLIQRFYDPTAGRILLDGVDLRDIALIDLRANIGVVSQEPLLFDTSIKENIRYGKMDATDEEIAEAARSANAHDFISRFPEGYDTSVGPRGCKLSGGQKQRVAIARAILRNPPILILDEATSALDNKSEKIVQRALDKLVESDDTQRTTIVIAHRLSTVRNADRIVVLGSPEGTSIAATGSIILEQGRHEELMAKENGYYKALVGAGQRQGSFRKSANEGNAAATETTALVEQEEEDDLSTVYSTSSKTSSLPSASKQEKDEDESKEETGFMAKLMGGKKQSPEEAEKAKREKERAKKNKSRVWTYTKPELCWIVFGALASTCKGTIFPLISIVFSEMIAVWYDSDTDRLREQSLYWSYMFYGLAFLSLIFETTQKVVFEMVGERLTTRLRSDMFRSMLRQDITWFEDEKNGLGILGSRLSTDVKLVRLVTGQSLAATLETCASLVTGIVIAAIASWEIFLVMLAMVPLLGFSEAANMMALQGSEGPIREELNKSINKLQETINGMREVQAFSLEQIVEDELENRINATIIPASRKAAFVKGMMMGLIQLIQFGVYAFAFWFGGLMIERERLVFEDFMMALFAMVFAASGLGQAAVFAGDATKAAAAVKSVFETLDERPAIDAEPWENNGKMDFKTGKPTVRELGSVTQGDGSSELSKVNFAYPTRKTAKIFDEVDLVIPSGKVVALVGSSGSGKSTVIQLLERFYDPISYEEEEVDGKLKIVVHNGGDSPKDDSNGIVKVEGKDMRDSDCRLIRKKMGLVGQEPVLFNDTIYNNIALGKEGCTREEVEKAAKSANAYDFIMKQEHKFDTMVGKGGSKVSGGQKQRIAIARALVSNPKILLLDEATSALDNESEKIVQASLDALVKEQGGDRTTIIIAHRLSTIKDADVICVFENKGEGSKVCEMGTHDELMKLGQKYKALVQAYTQ